MESWKTQEQLSIVNIESEFQNLAMWFIIRGRGKKRDIGWLKKKNDLLPNIWRSLGLTWVTLYVMEDELNPNRDYGKDKRIAKSI